ncbi:DUF6036 family nucleotidyltransferase [Humibacillus xanthopallidus]|uniref:DUF6036 family nucleotidyltransferase n=1 Tax=Humibacillus xanthopallidus TaxID=412689 RepID=UPI00384C9CFE
MAGLSRHDITQLLEELARRLDAAEVAARIYVVGGAAIALDWDTRRSTHDIDAVLHPRETVRSVAAEMAIEHHLPDDWLSDGVAAFVPTRETGRRPRVVARYANVEIVTAPAPHLLATKMAAFRQGDMEDLRVLVRHLRITTAGEIADLCERVYGPDSAILRAREELLWQAALILEG